VGTWRLISQTAELDDGTIIFPRGEDALGLLMYAANGWMSVQLMRRQRHPDERLDDLRTALEEYLGYFGRYTVDQARGIVVHHVVGCSYPGWTGSDKVREYSFEDEQLILRAVANGEGVQQRRVLIWERVRA
jgi:hypothetical protein